MKWPSSAAAKLWFTFPCKRYKKLFSCLTNLLVLRFAVTLVGYQDSRQLLIGKFPCRLRLSIKRTHLRSLVVRFIIICNSYPLCRIQILVCPYACKRFYWIRWGNFINMTSELVNMTCIFMTELTGPTLQLYDYRGLFILFFCGLLAGPGWKLLCVILVYLV